MSPTITAPQPPSTTRLAMIDLEQIKPKDGFNPRSKRDTGRFQQLRASIARHGIRQPLLVTPDPEHDGAFLIVAGEGRYLAALEEQLPQAPCLIDAVDPETDGLDHSLIENLIREDLSPLDEAHAFARLRNRGLLVRGIAERVQRTQKHVRDRLALLKLPEELHAQIDTGVIPLAAASALLALGKIHPGLPAVGVRRVLDGPPRQWDAPITWEDLAADPVSVVIGGVPEQYAQLPDDVYVAGHSYPINSVTLEQKAAADLVKLSDLQGTDVEQAEVRFSREMVEQALALSAAHPSKDGYEYLIVGSDIAGLLAGDQITRRLKDERAARRQRAKDGTPDTGPQPDGAANEPLTAQQLQEQQSRDREEAKHAARQAHAYNQLLGSQLTKQLWRIKLDDRVLRVLTAAPLAVELEKIAARGARIAFPGWQTETTRKSGTIQVSYLESYEAAGKAREYLDGASRAGEVAGRALALLAAARWADEDALPKSRRSRYDLRFARTLGVPWSEQAGELLDDILIERLSPEASEPIRQAKHDRETQRAARQQRDIERRRAVAALVQRAPTLTQAERKTAIAQLRREHGYVAVDRDTETVINQHAEPDTQPGNVPPLSSDEQDTNEADVESDGAPEPSSAKAQVEAESHVGSEDEPHLAEASV